MEFGCPVCNGFITLSKTCPKCGDELLEDRGTLEDYYGPYSPYDVQELYESVTESGNRECNCIHLMSCPACGYDERVGICQTAM